MGCFGGVETIEKDVLFDIGSDWVIAVTGRSIMVTCRMGHIGDAGHPDVLKAIDESIAKITGAGKVAGTLVNDANMEAYVQKGLLRGGGTGLSS